MITQQTLIRQAERLVNRLEEARIAEFGFPQEGRLITDRHYRLIALCRHAGMRANDRRMGWSPRHRAGYLKPSRQFVPKR